MLWQTGRIMAISGEFATVVTDCGIELSAVALDRIHWRPKLKRFVCFSSQVHEAVKTIAKTEEFPWARKPNSVGPGAYIVCDLPTGIATGFVIKRVTGGFLVSLTRGRRWVAQDRWITYDQDLKVWVAKGGGPRVDA